MVQQTRYTLRRSTASIMKGLVLYFLINTRMQDVGQNDLYWLLMAFDPGTHYANSPCPPCLACKLNSVR